MKSVQREILCRLVELPNPTRNDVNLVKLQVCGKLRSGCVPGNAELIRLLKPEERVKLLSVLKRKVVRTVSGVTVIAAMAKPYQCPKDSPCVYCPGGPQYGVPQSYTGCEPATRRGLQHRFDPYFQVKSRINQLRSIGHVVDKVELIIMGGTFPAMPTDYQEYFVQRCLDALNDVSSSTLEEAISIAEAGSIRNVGITVETRPDYAKELHVDHMLQMGVTRVELGVQTIYDDIYELINRGHNVEDVIEATRILKDSGLKVCYHMMPGLPGSNFSRDLEAFRTIFTDPSFKPDMLKIYPCLVLPGTKIYEWWLQGRYNPYTSEEAVRLIVEVKRMIPPWIRIMRVQRDIPANLIVAGVKHGNLREMIQERLRAYGLRCRCIRCREVGHRALKDGVEPNPENLEFFIRKEIASEGVDLFISVEDSTNDILVGYLRLRIPSEKAHRPEILTAKTAIVRELHVCGPLVPVGEHTSHGWQHKGYGAFLLAEAERIAYEDFDRGKMIITSAIGTRQYYMRFNYKHEGPYMVKSIKHP